MPFNMINQIIFALCATKFGINYEPSHETWGCNGVATSYGRTKTGHGNPVSHHSVASRALHGNSCHVTWESTTDAFGSGVCCSLCFPVYIYIYIYICVYIRLYVMYIYVYITVKVGDDTFLVNLKHWANNILQRNNHYKKITVTPVSLYNNLGRRK